MILGALIFAERPTGLQLVGVLAILTGLIVTTRRPRATTLEPEPA